VPSPTALPLGEESVLEAVQLDAQPLTGDRRDYDPLLELVGEARVVLLGEASHGTHEFHRERARITKRLITENGFSAIAIEGDWPDAYRVNRYVQGAGDVTDAEEALRGFRRFPTREGLLLFFHEFFHEREANGQDTIKVALLDDETGRVKATLPQPIMRPELEWERVGDVGNVVFVQGAVLRPDGTIYLTYGAADRCVGAAIVDTAEVLEALRLAA
jgi:hypothetical protein